MAWCWWSTFWSHRMCFRLQLLSFHAAHHKEVGGPNLPEPTVQAELLAYTWSRTNTPYLGTATSSLERRGIWTGVSWREKSENMVLGRRLSPRCHQTRINPRGEHSLLSLYLLWDFLDVLTGIKAGSTHVQSHPHCEEQERARTLHTFEIILLLPDISWLSLSWRQHCSTVLSSTSVSRGSHLTLHSSTQTYQGNLLLKWACFLNATLCLNYWAWDWAQQSLWSVLSARGSSGPRLDCLQICDVLHL